MSARVEFISTELSLLSLPRDIYPLFFHGIVRLFLEAEKLRAATRASSPQGSDNMRQREEEDSSSSSDSEPDVDDYFCSVTITPEEVSILCPHYLLNKVFGSAISLTGAGRGFEIAKDRYILVRVDGEGRDDSTKRISEVSTLLAEARVPIFFLSAYFSDYILFPKSSYECVQQVFSYHGFTFLDDSPYASIHEDSNSSSRPVSMPPEFAEKVDALSPELDSSVKLLLVGTRAIGATEELELAIMRTLVKAPQYFCISVHGNEYSCVVDSEELKQWPQHALLGSPRDYVVPMSINLADAPIDVVGVAADVSTRLLALEVPIHYVSTAHSCVVLVPLADQAVAAEAFTPANSN